MLLTGAQILMEVLVSQGVDTVFGYPGGTVLNIYDALYENSHRIHHVLTAHEQGAAHAADAYARASGKTGVVIATSGPGATNLVTGIATAHLDSTPMVAVTGNVALPLLGRDSFQEVDIVGITQPVVKHSFVVRDIAELEKTLQEAFYIANSGRKGPVLVDIPKNIQITQHEYLGQPLVVTEDPVPKENPIALALEAIKAHKKPYLYVGGGVLAANAQEEVLELSKRLSAPIGLSMMGLTAIPASYEWNLGMSGMHGKYAASKAQSKCDLILALGVRFSDRATGDVNEYTKKCTVIHIDIDQAELGKNVSPDIELCGDVKEIVASLLAELPQMENPQWLQEVAEYKKVDNAPSAGFTPKNIIELVNAYTTPDTLVATDVGQHQMWTMQYYKFQQPRTLLTSGGLGTMGFGMGAAIGGSMAKGRKKTILFTGDGSLGMNLNELATVASENLPIVIVLLNNGVLGMVRQWQTRFFEHRYSQTTLNRKTDFVLLAKAFGLGGYQANNLEELEEILKETAEGSTPVLIDCRIDNAVEVLPMIPPGGSVKNIILE